MTYFNRIQLADSADKDAFGRLRVSNPVNLYDFKHLYNVDGFDWQNTVVNNSGNASVTHNANKACATLAVGTANGDSAIHQTKRYIAYQPGKSQLIILTGKFGANITNVRKRYGSFDAYNGIFFEYLDGVMSLVKRSYTTGSVVDTSVVQSAWNLDKMDGTGRSGITVDWTKNIILIIDYEWLGSGRIRFGTRINGITYYFHEMVHSNLLTTVYMTTPTLPIRGEITNISGSAGDATFDIVCCSVNSEGGSDLDHGISLSVSNGITSRTATTTRTPILAISPKTTFNGVINRKDIIPMEFSALVGTNNCLIELIYNGTLTNASWVSANSNSAVNYDVSSTAISGGSVLDSIYIASGSGGVRTSASMNLNTKIRMCLDANGSTFDNFCVCATSFTSTATVNSTLNWLEMT